MIEVLEFENRIEMTLEKLINRPVYVSYCNNIIKIEVINTSFLLGYYCCERTYDTIDMIIYEFINAYENYIKANMKE